jgi:serine/threonine-protein kinase
VWRAHDLELQRAVAIKLLHPQPDLIWEQIRAEARKAARLDHPNVVTVYDVGADGAQAFMVMELVDGPNLAQLLSTEPSGRADPGLVTQIAVQTAAALDAAHAVGVVHADIKPGNLLLASDGTIKVSDFGIATADRVERPGPRLVGTPSYVSPEQVSGRPVSELSDWYALGCVLYELLAGRPPFVGESVEDVLSQHVHAAPLPIQAVRPDIDPGLGAVVMRLLAKDPGERLASLASIRAAVEPRDGGERTRVLPQLEEPLVVDRPRSRRPPLVLIAAAVTAVLLVAAAVAFLRDQAGSDTPAAGASTPAPVTSERPTSPRASATRPAPSSPPSKATSETDAAVALDSLAKLLRQGGQGKEGEVAREAAKDADEAGREMASGRSDKAAEKYRDLRKRLAEAERDGRWSPTPQVTALLRQLDATFPTSN